jgi:hypothetical protein
VRSNVEIVHVLWIVEAWVANQRIASVLCGLVLPDDHLGQTKLFDCAGTKIKHIVLLRWAAVGSRGHTVTVDRNTLEEAIRTKTRFCVMFSSLAVSMRGRSFAYCIPSDEQHQPKASIVSHFQVKVTEIGRLSIW